MPCKYYLIDFENVNTAKALKGFANLDANDKVVIFYTEGAKIDLNLIDGINFLLKKVEPGDQSLDKYLVSYLGYLIAKDESAEFFVVSNDKGFDRIIKFWASENNAKVSRVAKLETPKQTQLKTTTTKTKEKSTQASKKTTESSAKTQLNTDIQRAVAAEGYDKKVCNKVASIAVSFYGNEKMALEIHNALVAEYTDGTEIYAVVKSVISKYAKTSTTKTKSAKQESVDVKEIRKILTTAGKTSDVANYVGQLVQNNVGQKNGKQTIYRAIISKYGQSAGLDIYNRIKKKI